MEWRLLKISSPSRACCSSSRLLFWIPLSFCSRWQAFFTAAESPSSVVGFRTKSATSYWMACWAYSKSGKPVHRISWMSGQCSRTQAHSCSPSISGMRMSVMTMSGGDSWIWRTASAPS